MTQEQIDNVKAIMLLFLSGLPQDATVEEVIYSLEMSHVTAEEVNNFVELFQKPTVGNA